MLRKHWQVLCLYSVLLMYISLFFFQKVNFTASDLGRHLQNGRVISQTHSVFSSNFYSYTTPDFPVTNHHWLFGVLAHTIHSYLGFNGLTVVSACIHTFAIGLLLLYLAHRFKLQPTLNDHFPMLLATLIALPLLTSRYEFRPESISYLFIIITYITISTRYRNVIPLWLTLLVLLPLQILWVNTHIFFIMSLGITGVFGIQSLLEKQYSKTRELIVISVLLLPASLCNPSTVEGVLEPLSIFTNYGYRIAENQGLLFLSNYGFKPLYGYIFILVALIVLKVLRDIKNLKQYRTYTAELLLALSFIVFGLKMVRLLSFTGIFVLPVLLLFALEMKATVVKKLQKPSATHQLLFSTMGTALFFIAVVSKLFIPAPALGLGVMPGNNASAEFFREHGLTGPIFNNYDIGGYLIYNLYPRERVFVDNRPEAYPSSFFSETYIPAQESEENWQKLHSAYNFNVIYFYRHDLTPWAQKFMLNRVADENWVPIYVDDYVLIFIRNTEKNASIIEKFALPKEIFTRG